MDKLNINDFPCLDGVSLIPTKTLQLIIDAYNNKIDQETYQLEQSAKKRAYYVMEGKEEAYEEEEFLQRLKKSGL